MNEQRRQEMREILLREAQARRAEQQARHIRECLTIADINLQRAQKSLEATLEMVNEPTANIIRACLEQVEHVRVEVERMVAPKENNDERTE